MRLLESNITALLAKEGKQLKNYLKAHDASSVEELKVKDLDAFCHERDVTLINLLQHNLSIDTWRLKFIKLLILDVDGVMTDGGMYFTENGDQMKRYNTKDGMAILALKDKGLQIGIISSGFKQEMVKARADLLKIDHFYVGRDPKIKVLKKWCNELKIDLSEVGIIGDDINDLEVIKSVGFSACPSDAVPAVKSNVDLVLQKKGGEGCVRELIDHYILEEPLH